MASRKTNPHDGQKYLTSIVGKSQAANLYPGITETRDCVLD